MKKQATDSVGERLASPAADPSPEAGNLEAKPADPAERIAELERELAAVRADAEQARELADKLNGALREEIAERKRTEEALRESRGRISRDLDDAKALQRTGSLLIEDHRSGGIDDRILETAMAIMSADFGCIHAADPEGGDLLMLAAKNFHADSAEFWRRIRVPSGAAEASGVPLRHERILISDVEAPGAVAEEETLRHYLLSGIKAVHSTPLLTRGGRLVGLMATHWRWRHQADDRSLALFDVLARQMADVLERRQTLEALRASELWLAGQNEAFESALNGATLEDSLSVLVRAAVAHMKGEDRCAFYIADRAEHGLYHIVGMSDEPASSADGLAVGPGSFACDLAFHPEQPVVSAGDQGPLWETWRWLAEEHGYRDRWSFPIETAAGRTIGTATFHFKTPRAATARDREFAAVLTRSAGIIISRSQEAAERARAQESLLESQSRLKTAAAELEEADRRKNDFLAVLGHELRNPLAAIRTGVALLRSEKARPESRLAALPIVADQIGHMQRLVDDLLDLTRVVHGSIEVQRQPMAVQEALRQAVEMVRLQPEADGFTLEMELPDEPLEILGDRIRLTQVFMNVLGNAVKYSDRSRRIEISAVREDRHAVVRIRDHGRGISPELLPRIFEPFVQATPGLTLQAGLGLGLAVVRQLVRLHDGDVEIFSQGESQGSELVVRLPLLSAA